MRLACVLLLLSCVIAVHAYRPPGCSRVRCPPLACRYPYVPRGSCCPVCPRGRKTGTCPMTSPFGPCINFCNSDFDCPGRDKCCSSGCGRMCLPVASQKPQPLARRPTRDCSAVLCLRLTCSDQYTPPGSCCPVCRAPRQTGLTRYTRPTRPSTPTRPRTPYRPVSNCQGVRCARLFCDDQYTPSKACCPVCKAKPKVSFPCWEVLCRPLSCPDQYTPRGACCPVCRARPDPCAKVWCPERHCEGAYTPEGSCCQVCPGCNVEGVYYEDSDSVPSYDVCTECTCDHGDVRCQQKQCEYLNCDDSYTPPGECCPKCPDKNGH